MNLHPATIPSPQEYADAFESARRLTYPEIEAYEAAAGFRLDRSRAEAAARILACPVKANPPNWQHGYVLYAAARKYLAARPESFEAVRCVDVGTAKGYSALVLRWALNDAGVRGFVESVDVIAPSDRVFRNSVLDTERSNRLSDYHADWPEAGEIRFAQSTGVAWLARDTARVHIACVDGKHTTDAVSREGAMLAERQQPGDVVFLDDVQIPGVERAVALLEDRYALETIRLKAAERAYAVGVRR